MADIQRHTTTGIPHNPELGRESLASVTNISPPNIEEILYDAGETHLMHGRVFVGSSPVEYTGEFPEELRFDNIALLVPGFGGFKRTSRALRHALATQGQASISFEPIRADDRSISERLTRPHTAHAQTLEAIASDLSRTKLAGKNVPNRKDIDTDTLTLVPHSMGELSAVPFAEAHHQQVDALISLGTVGKQNISPLRTAPTFIKGLVPALRKEFIPYILSGDIEMHPSNVGRLLNYYGRNPLRTFGELVSCMRQNLSESNIRLGQLGVKTAYLAFEHDILVTQTGVVEDLVDKYEVMPGTGHIAPQAKAAKVARWIMETKSEFASAT